VFRFIDREKATHPIRVMCRLFGVSPSGYHAWKTRPISTRAFQDQLLLELIRDSYHRSRDTYGSPRVWEDLREAGVCIGRKRVARLMRKDALCGAYRPRRWKTTRRGRRLVAPAADHVDRLFAAPEPNQLWVADIKHVETDEGPLFIAAVQDAFSRRIVGWSMRENLRTQIVLDALDMAVQTRRPDAVIHHSDQGCQYTSIAFGLACRRANITPSMGSVGDCFDNALAESFWATLERDLLSRYTFATRLDARSAIFDYIEGFYNSHRRHSALGQISPVEFERRWTVQDRVA
jgi:putative transposase